MSPAPPEAASDPTGGDRLTLPGDGRDVSTLSQESCPRDPQPVQATPSEFDSEVETRLAFLLSAPRSPEEVAVEVQALALNAEAALGNAFIEENKGRLWEHPEARPYLRARKALAELLERSGKVRQALPHFEALLRLCKTDPLGVRPHLALCYAVLDRPKRLSQLLAANPDETLVLAWMRVLERHLAGDLEGALAKLARAQVLNSHVRAFLTAERRTPRPGAPTDPGSEGEAMAALRYLAPAWGAHRDALYWLFKAPKG